MITVEDLLKLPPEYTDNDSRWLFDSCFKKVTDNEWVLYDSYYQPYVESSVNRFINSHSLIPNPYNDLLPIEGVRPMAVGYFKSPVINKKNYSTEMFLFMFLNGAVTAYHTTDEVPGYQLFIEKKLVKYWVYPDDYFTSESFETDQPNLTS